MKEEEQLDHPVLKEIVEMEILEDWGFDKREQDVIKNILKKVEIFCEVSRWKKMVDIHKEVKTFERKSGEKIENYIA